MGRSFLVFVYVTVLALLLMAVTPAAIVLGENHVVDEEEGEKGGVNDIENDQFVHKYIIPPPPSHVIYENIKNAMDNEEK